MAVDTDRINRLSPRAKIGEMLVAISEGRNEDADAYFRSVVNGKVVDRIRNVLDTRPYRKGI